MANLCCDPMAPSCGASRGWSGRLRCDRRSGTPAARAGATLASEDTAANRIGNCCASGWRASAPPRLARLVGQSGLAATRRASWRNVTREQPPDRSRTLTRKAAASSPSSRTKASGEVARGQGARPAFATIADQRLSYKDRDNRRRAPLCGLPPSHGRGGTIATGHRKAGDPRAGPGDRRAGGCGISRKASSAVLQSRTSRRQAPGESYRARDANCIVRRRFSHGRSRRPEA